MKIRSKELQIMNLCIPRLTEFGEIHFEGICDQLASKGISASVEVIAGIFMKHGFCYKDDCINITGVIVDQYYLNENGRMLFSAHSYENYLAIQKEESYKRKIRLSRSDPKDWLD